MKTQQKLDFLDKFKEQIINKQIFCPQGKLSTQVCSKQSCNLSAFICEQQECICRSSHKLCIQSKTQKIIDALISNSISLQPLIDKINNLFQKSIQSLSDMRDQIILQFKQKYQIQGLQYKQFNFINAIKSSQIKQISCSFMWDIVSKIHTDKENFKKIYQIQIEINQLWSSFDQKLKNFEASFKKYLETINVSLPKYFEGSQLINNRQNEKNIINFFDGKKIKSAFLLYRASSDGFKSDKFYQKCNNHNDTLTILQTQYGKVIGGYTPVKWNQRPYGNYISDPKSLSFLFSLTLNQKIPVIQSKASEIYNQVDGGPSFGGGHDLHICSKADKAANSYTNIGKTFNNGKFIYGDDQSRKRFAGNYKFKIVDWQVWKLQFEKE